MKDFKLKNEPIDFVLTIHINNIVQTYGREKLVEWLLTFQPSTCEQITKQTIKQRKPKRSA